MENITGLTTVLLGGKERPIYFGFLQSKLFCQAKKLEYWQYTDEVNKAFGRYNFTPQPTPDNATDEEKELILQANIQAMMRRMDLIVLADLIYSALCAGLKHRDYKTEAKDFDEDDVMFWIGDLYQQGGTELQKVYTTLLAANSSPNVQTQAAEQAKS